MYSLDQWVAVPPLSLIYSLMLICGLDLIGAFSLRLLGYQSTKVTDWIRWQAPMFGAMSLTIFLYPAALAGYFSLAVIKSVAFLCCFLGLINVISTGRSLWLYRLDVFDLKIRDRLDWLNYALLFLLITGMGLLACGPVTNADALDYHLGVAIAILNEGQMPVVPEWIHGRLAGNGEVLNAFALSIGAEQFGSLLQYVSLMGIFGTIRFGTPFRVAALNTKQKELISLAAFSAPVLLFLVSTPKPQLWPISMTSFAFTLVVHPQLSWHQKGRALLNFMLICILCMTASQAKFNYLLGGGIVGTIALARMKCERLLFPASVIFAVTVLLILLPPVSWKVHVFQAHWMEVFLTPLPGHLPGDDAYLQIAKNAKDLGNLFSFPLLLFVPTSFGAFSTLLGFGGVVLIGMRAGRDPWIRAGILGSVVLVVLSVGLAPLSARVYVEPYFWLMILLSFQTATWDCRQYYYIKWVVFAQACIFVIACWFGVFTQLPGALSEQWRKQAMRQMANGYEIMEWLDGALPKNAVVLNGQRSMALVPRDAVAYDWSNYSDPKSSTADIYLNRLRERKVSHFLVLAEITPSMPLYKCFGEIAAGPGIGHIATRNPFNQGATYRAWIVEFDATKLPECAK